MSERKRSIGTVLLSIGSIIMLLMMVGMFTNIVVVPDFLYFIGGVLEGVGVVFFLSSFVIKEDYTQNIEMM